MVSFVYALRL
uniref:Uncharacterized protein n=1 Tax=Anguilla anguilla TaxID=7936 RepID=A0A0E9P710_ANGAN